MQHSSAASLEDASIALVLSGGNALGAYQGGAYQALSERRMEPDWVAGASIGAINGAVICGNPSEERVSALKALWRVTEGNDAAGAIPEWLASSRSFDEARRTHAAAMTFAAGQPGLFVPRSVYGPWWNPLANPETSSLYDLSPLEARLESLTDFDRLNGPAPRFSATAVDVESGESIVFDTRTHRITPRHLRASGALIPTFSPVEAEGRTMGDAGLSANLPLDTVLAENLHRSTDAPALLCIAIDLLPLAAPPPKTLGESVSRTQDLLFACQSRRAIAAWQAIYGERAKAGAGGSVTILYIAYADQSREVSGKAFDFSPATVRDRWQSGYRDVSRAIDAISAGALPLGQPGLTVHALSADDEGDPLVPVHWSLAPTSA